MRISDWSSDVCSSDLVGLLHRVAEGRRQLRSALDRRPALGVQRNVVGRARGPGDAQPAGIAFDRVEEGRRRLREAEGMVARRPAEIGRAHVRTPVTNAQLVCRLLLEKKNICY